MGKNMKSHRAPDFRSMRHTASFHWLSNFTYGKVYVSMLSSQSIPPSPVVHTTKISQYTPLKIKSSHFSAQKKKEKCLPDLKNNGLKVEIHDIS